MKRVLPILVFLMLYLLINQISAGKYSYHPQDKILLNCGSTIETQDNDYRKWEADDGSKFESSINSQTIISRATTQAPSVNEVPYMTARIFLSEFTFSIPVSSGRKFVRLYFYPSSYPGSNPSDSIFSPSDAVFSVISGPFTLFRNFSPAQTAKDPNYVSFMKEFSINVDTGRMNITFKPSNRTSSYAFVNGIEVISMPDIYNTTDAGIDIVGEESTFVIDKSSALENIVRLNVGGNVISPRDDTGLFRTWYDDITYVFSAQNDPIEDQLNKIRYPKGMPSYVAPLDLYRTARVMGPNGDFNAKSNLSWYFTIDPGFWYFVRLHFCELESPIVSNNMRVFSIYLNNQTAFKQFDVFKLAGGNGVPLYKDFVVLAPYGTTQQDLWLQLHPFTESRPVYYNAILNGLEIFKVNNTDGNLGGPNPLPNPDKPDNISPSSRPLLRTGKSKSKVGIIAGGVVGGVVGLCLLCFVILVGFKRKRGESSAPTGTPGWVPLSPYPNSPFVDSSKTNTTGSYGSLLCRHFSFAEIEAATKNFDENLILGVGGFGKVYKGEIDGGTTKVAIKRGNPLSSQGIHEFQTEIEVLSQVRHLHLVSLIGYCEENCEMIIVYDYMANGTLREHLYKTQRPPLPWKQRLEICIGAARGLQYLHTDAKHTFIHRDVKTTNILLDEKWVAKVSDFGLSKEGPVLDKTHVSTLVKGSYGYLDPEYFLKQQLTEKSDVYSFGVVLFEVLCARPALNTTLPREEVSLADWALHCQKKGILDQIIDPYLKGQIASECLMKFAEIAGKCLADQGINRPAMGDVVWSLEFALKLQETVEGSGNIKFDISDSSETLFTDTKNVSCGSITESSSSGMAMSTRETSITSVSSDGLTPGAVFSQIMNPSGR